MAKKKVRTLRYKTMRINEQAPRAGEITQDKDTIIVHQVSDTEAKAYATDQNGKLLEITSSSQSNAEGSNAIDKGGFLEMLKSHLGEAKELLENAKLVKSTFVNDTDVPIRFRTESGRWIELKEREERVFYFNKAVVGTGSELLTFNGEDYPNQTFSITGTDELHYFGEYVRSSTVLRVRNTQQVRIKEVKNVRDVYYTVELEGDLEGRVYLGSGGETAYPSQDRVEVVHDEIPEVLLDVYDVHSDHLRVEVDGEEIQVYQQDASVAMYKIPARDARIRVTEVVQ